MIELGSLEEYINNEQFIEHCKVLASNYKTNGRTNEQVLIQTLYGEAVEKICADKLNLTQTPFHVSTYDATKNNLKIEIKHTAKDSKWWSFKPESYMYFIQNSKDLDFIILCYVDKTNNTGSTCYLKYIAHAKTFINYVKQSHYNESYYYHVDNAISANQCYEINNIEDANLLLKGNSCE